MADLMQQASELLLCPFCGGEAERIDFGPGAGENEGGSCIACRRCRASGPVEFGFKENFIANWNRRAAAQEAVGWFTDDYLTDKSATTYDPLVAERWRNKGWPVTALYAAPVTAAPADTWFADQPSPGGQRDDSPMAKMAAALRGKAEAERAAFDQRVQSGEWGPMPDNPDVLELPPLPEEVDSVRCMIRGEKGFAEPCDYYFTSKQMRDYARTALAVTAAPGIDLQSIRKVAMPILCPMLCASDAESVVRKLHAALIDASPKGGDVRNGRKKHDGPCWRQSGSDCGC